MDKPQPKREMAIEVVHKTDRFIVFVATPDAAGDMAQYGQLYPRTAGRYVLYVDARYDFDEVVAYIERYGKTTEGDTE